MKHLIAIIMAASIGLGGCVCLGAGWVYEFDGVDDYISTPASPLMRFSASQPEMTYSFWVYLYSYGAGNSGRIYNDRGVSGVLVYAIPDGSLVFGVTGGGPACIAPAGTIALGRWYNVVFVRADFGAGSGLTLDGRWYVDGAIAVTTADWIYPIYDGFPIFGDDATHVRQFDGQIHAARIYNRALSAAECRGLYKAGGGRNDFGALSIVLPRADDQSLVFSLDRPADTYSTGDTVVEVRDASPSGNDGTLEPSVAAGPVWSADGYLFDGGTQYIERGDIEYDSKSLTVSARITRVGAGSDTLEWAAAHWNDTSASRAWALGLNTSRRPAMFVRGTSSANATSATSINNGESHLITGVYDGTTVYIYVDGILKDSTPFSQDLAATVEPITIARQSGASFQRLFNGTIDDPRIYSYALSSNQVYNLSQGIAPTNTPVLHYPFNAPSYSITSKGAARNYGLAKGGVTVGPAAIATPAP